MKKETEKASLLSRWKGKAKKESESTMISKIADAINLPLSSGQQRLFFLDQLYPGNPVYNSSEIYTFKGRLKLEDLERSLQVVFSIHSALRCSFHLVDGIPVQKVDHTANLSIAKFDLSSLAPSEKKEKQDQILTADSLKPFDLSNPPLIRVSLLKLTSEEHILFVTLHHIITDKWSMGIFQEQLAKFYKTQPSVEEINTYKARIQFTDYAHWEQQREIDKTQLGYWKQKLSGNIPILDLPTDRPPTVNQSFMGGSQVQRLSKNLSAKVLELCSKLNTTPYVLLLSVYNMLLHKYSGQKDILIGSPISTRGSKTLEHTIGFFDETVVLRNTVSGATSFSQLVQEVRTTVLDAFSNKDIPFDAIVKEISPARSMSGNPFFRTMFIYHDATATPFFDSELDVSYTFYNTGISKFDLTLYIANEDGILVTEFEYFKALFDVDSIARFQEHFRVLLEGITADPLRNVAEIPMLTEKEMHLFQPKSFSTDGPYERFSSIHAIIVEQALKNPDNIALVFGSEAMTYKEFNEESDLVAKRILAFTKGENQIVGLCLERSNQMMVGLLGILKAGCAYLPIDLEYPKDRIGYMLSDSKVSVLLTQASLVEDYEFFNGTTVLIDDSSSSNFDSEIALPIIDDTHLAYIIYTSGSTGKPKGVPITHANLLNSTAGRLTFYTENPKAFLLMSSISFDSSKAGIYWTLCSGGTLVISENRLEQDIDRIGSVIYENKVSHTLMLPSLYKMLIEYSATSVLSSLNTVIVAGEACSSSMCELHFDKLPGVSLYNEYGPTEATVWCIAHQIKRKDLEGSIPIGKPVANAEIYLLDIDKNLVPIGAVGEIYIGGPGLASGYLNRPDLTEKAFVTHPFTNDKEKKLYKTGDLGRFKKNGEIAFLGRVDQQVKIRGYRIEIDEIEKAIASLNGVKEVVVVVEESVVGEPELSLKGTPTVSELEKLISLYEAEDKIEELLDSIQSLSSSKKEYILQEIGVLK